MRGISNFGNICEMRVFCMGTYPAGCICADLAFLNQMSCTCYVNVTICRVFCEWLGMHV